MTTVWRAFLDWMTPEERRSLLDTEFVAAEYAQALRSAGLPMAGAFDDGPALDVLAQVLSRRSATRPTGSMDWAS